MRTWTYTQVQQEFPEAWSALPSSYQNDNCLSFYQDLDGMLCADADLGLTQTEVYLWETDSKTWKFIPGYMAPPRLIS